MLVVDDPKDNLQIYVDREPIPTVKSTRLYSKEELKKPYLNKYRVIYTIYYKDQQYAIMIPKGYDWDGASIPFGTRWLIGSKGSPKFLIPSMVHDRLCENKKFLKGCRYLSSLVFRELLIAYGSSKLKANIMFNAVDNYQKTQGWEKYNG